MPTINCLCIVHETEDPSWINVTRLRMENDLGQPRYDEIRVYLPRIIGITKTKFVHELDKNDKLNYTYRTIRYHGMESEQKHAESRAVQIGCWTIWNKNAQNFSQPIDFSRENYMFIKFPRDYWDELERNMNTNTNMNTIMNTNTNTNMNKNMNTNI